MVAAAAAEEVSRNPRAAEVRELGGVQGANSGLTPSANSVSLMCPQTAH